MQKELSIEIYRDKPISIEEQIVDQISDRIHSGVLRPGDKIPTIRDLEIDLGVCLSTIRRAFNRLDKSGYIIRKPRLGTFISEKYKSRPSQLDSYNGDLLQHKETFLRVGIIMPKLTLTNQRLMNLLDILESRVADDHGSCQVLFIENFSDDLDQVKKEIESLNSIILFYSDGLEDMIMTFMKTKKPMVVYDYSGDLKVSSVNNDWGWAVEELMNFVISKGHKKIAFASFSSSNNETWPSIREKAYINFCKAQNNSFPQKDILRTEKDFFLEDFVSVGKKIVRENFTSLKNYTAIIAVNDKIALGITEEVQKYGIKVPQDLSVVGFDNDREAISANLTTVMHPFEEDANSLLEILKRHLHDKQKNIIIFKNKPKIIIRKSLIEA